MVDLRATSDADLARLLGVRPPQISNWFCGHTKPRSVTIAKMASRWGVSEDEVRSLIKAKVEKYDRRTFGDKDAT